jgi:hypothetical protein
LCSTLELACLASPGRPRCPPTLLARTVSIRIANNLPSKHPSPFNTRQRVFIATRQQHLFSCLLHLLSHDDHCPICQRHCRDNKSVQRSKTEILRP